MLVLTPASMFSTSLRLQNSKWILSQMCICRFNVFRTQHQQKWNKFLVFTFHLNMNWHSQSRLNRNPNIKYPSEGTWRGKLWPDYERLILKVAKACWLRKSCVPMSSGPWWFIWNSCCVVYTEILKCMFASAVHLQLSESQSKSC